MKKIMKSMVRVAGALLITLVLMALTVLPLMAAQTDPVKTTLAVDDESQAIMVRLAGQVQPPKAPLLETATDGSKQSVIDEGGTYILSGSISHPITVAAGADVTVTLVLDNLDVASTSGPAVHVISAGHVSLYVKPGTTNRLSDGASSDATIYSTADLTLFGSGTLLIDGTSAHGIEGNDDVVIFNANLTIAAVGDGIKANDSVVLVDTAVTITAGGDGIQAKHDEDASKGYVAIIGSTIGIKADKDGVQASSLVLVQAGLVSITAQDDGINAADEVLIDSGSVQIYCQDDAVHADRSIIVNAGSVNVEQCYEGLEASSIAITGGSVRIVADDDGINTVSQNEATDSVAGQFGFPPMGRGGFEASDGSTFVLTGGYVFVDADGDGIDVNGGAYVSGGTLIVSGPVDSANGALDWAQNFTVTGGTIVATGSSGMAQGIGTDSTQYGVSINLGSTCQAGTAVAILDANGNQVVAIVPDKEYSNVVYSSPALQQGADYGVSVGGTVTGPVHDSIVGNGNYHAGTSLAQFTMSSIVQTVGTAAGGMGMPFGRTPTGSRPDKPAGQRPTW